MVQNSWKIDCCSASQIARILGNPTVRSITLLTTARHWPLLSGTNRIHTLSQPPSLRPVLIYCYLCPGLTSRLFSTKTIYAFLSSEFHRSKYSFVVLFSSILFSSIHVEIKFRFRTNQVLRRICRICVNHRSSLWIITTRYWLLLFWWWMHILHNSSTGIITSNSAVVRIGYMNTYCMAFDNSVCSYCGHSC